MNWTRANIRYKTAHIDGLDIFYREAGPQDAPVVLLLHGFPSSSRMYETLLPPLADRYRLIAPDYPGFGHSTALPPSEFVYTFDNIARVMTRFADRLELDRFALFVQDYGGPVGFRMAQAQPVYNIVDLGLLAGDSNSQGFGISPNGTFATGRSVTGNFTATRAFSWTQGGGMTALPNLGSPSRPFGVGNSVDVPSDAEL